MSNIQVFNPKSNVPAFAKKAELSAMAKALAGGGSQGKRISVKGGVFRLYSEGKEVAAIEDRFLDVVLVAAAPKITRTFYLKQYDPDAAPTAPDCWSADGDTPDKTAKDPQSDRCATCPQNAKGSGQGDSRACRFSQRLAVVLANDMEGDVLQLSCAATSIFGKGEGDQRPLQDYARWLTAQGHDPGMFVTRMKFDTTAATPKLFFKAMRWLTDEEFAICQEKAQSPDAIKAITMTVDQMDGVKEAPVSVPGKAPKAAAPAPEPEDDEPPAPPPRTRAAAPAPAEDDEPPAPAPKKTRAKAAPAPAEEDAGEPEVRKAAAPAAPASTKASIAKVLDDWGTDD